MGNIDKRCAGCSSIMLLAALPILLSFMAVFALSISLMAASFWVFAFIRPNCRPTGSLENQHNVHSRARCRIDCPPSNWTHRKAQRHSKSGLRFTTIILTEIRHCK
jgi:hypothetical protein